MSQRHSARDGLMLPARAFTRSRRDAKACPPFLSSLASQEPRPREAPPAAAAFPHFSAFVRNGYE